MVAFAKVGALAANDLAGTAVVGDVAVDVSTGYTYNCARTNGTSTTEWLRADSRPPAGDIAVDLTTGFSYVCVTDSGESSSTWRPNLPLSVGPPSGSAATDTTRLQAAIDQISAAGGGCFELLNYGSVYLTTGLTWKSNVFMVGVGMPTIKLADGSNATVIQGNGFASLTGTDTNGGISNFGIFGVILDGNRANNTSPAATAGHGLAFYGRDFYIDNLEVINARRTGLWTEYATGAVGTSPFNGNVNKLLVDSCGENGWLNKVSDLHATNVNIRSASLQTNNTYDAINLASTGAERLTGVNVWTGGSDTNRPRYALLIQGAGATVSNLHLETAATANLRVEGDFNHVNNLLSYNVVGTYNISVKSNKNKISGSCYPGAFNSSAVALQLGASTETPSQNEVRLSVSGYTAGVVDFTNTAGNNHIYAIGNQGSGTITLGTPSTTDRWYCDVTLTGHKKIFGGKASAAIAIGDGCSATNTPSAAIGDACTASGAGAYAIGNACTASGSNSHAFGNTCTAATFNTLATGGRSNAALYGMRAHAAGMFAAAGDAQSTELVWNRSTSDATAGVEMFLNGDTATVRAVLPSNTTWAFNIDVVGRKIGGGSLFFHRLTNGLITKVTTAASTTMTVAPTDTALSTPAGWACAASADTTNGSLKLTVTGEAATDIRWVAVMRASQVQG